MKKPPLQNVLYTAVTLTAALAMNLISYSAAKLLISGRPHSDLTVGIDSFFPFIPWTAALYIGCFLFWAVNYCTCSLSGRPGSDRLFCADILAKTVCFLLFIIIPTTNTRPEVTGNSVWDRLIGLVYRVDSPENLFPSMHCAISWLCWAGVRSNRNVTALHRAASLFMALVTCICTLTTKQHVFVDTVSGVLIAEACYRLAAVPVLRDGYGKLADKCVALLSRLVSRRE